MPNLNMQMKHIRIFQLSIPITGQYTFTRIFFINLRISCQKLLAALQSIGQIPHQSPRGEVGLTTDRCIREGDIPWKSRS